MNIKLNYDEGFNDLWFRLHEKYPKELFDIDGVGKQLDMADFSKEFFSRKPNTTVADISVDANANVSDNSVISYDAELMKPFERLNSYYMLWKNSKKYYGTEFANSVVESQLIGDYYINDFHHFFLKPYCFNYSTYDVMTNGLPYIDRIKCIPPKYLLTFKQQMEQFTVFASNNQSGASGEADLLVIMSYYVKNAIITLSDCHFNFKSEDDVWKYVREIITSYIYTINQPFRANQSPFVNISLYDKYFMHDMCKDIVFPDGSHPNENIINRLQNIYVEVMNKELSRTAITYPVTTACYSIDENRNIKDEDFNNFISKANLQWGFINIYDGDSSTLSSCCFDGSQMCLSKSSNGVNYMSFKDLYNSSYKDNKKNFTIFHNGSWVKGKAIQLPKTQMYKITTSNKKEMIVTSNHIFPTLNGDKKVDKLTVNDYLMFNNRKLDSFPEQDKHLTYEQGILIGMYLGDGSMDNEDNDYRKVIQLSLNQDKYESSQLNISQAVSEIDNNTNIRLGKIYNNVYPLTISGEDNKVYQFIREYVSGKYSFEKELNMDCLLQSYAFRKGILDGYYLTDGGNSNRIYTTSKKLVGEIECLITSLGMNSVIDMSDRTSEPCIIRGEEYNHNYPLYCIRWYDMKNKRSMDNIYKIFNNSEYFKINAIDQIETTDDYVYCFEMENQNEPYFTLPNGVISHNCRLRSSVNNEFFNSYGAGSSKIGSLGVVTLNLAKAGKQANKDKEWLLKRVAQLTETACKINNVKRNILKQRIENGNLPLYNLGYMELTKQYSTTGVNGLNECVKFMGEDVLTKSGQDLQMEIIDTINSVNDRMSKTYHVPTNAEQTPSESSAVKLAKKDTLLNIQNEYKLYSNQFIPLITNADMLDRIKLQGMFDSHFSGGSVLHLSVENQITDVNQMKELIRSTVKSGTVYFAVNYNLQKCENGHMTVGRKDICPICGKPITDNYVRVVGKI